MMAMDIRNATHGERYWEIDALRGVAIVAMVLFHIVFDLSFFGILPAE
ncbi:MAG: heparan-alpha-glucosaminide N-acetyltransferase domain-containing protein, partial [Methanomicrobiaceae archaeon]|nr:heparan-alpha-glucosaminide N-acetyltransferase domain-containing protein [Methanomicrobiaceae archaeon]